MNLRILFLALTLAASAGFAQTPYPGNDADHGVANGSRFIAPYTGNVAFSTSDLAVAGAVGMYGLRWQRHATSRTPQAEPLFGLAHNWTHSYQYEMVDAGSDKEGRRMLSFRAPLGAEERFTQTSTGAWNGSPSMRYILAAKGDDFVVTATNGNQSRFTRARTARGDVFTLRERVDPEGNIWAFAWIDGRLSQVTEPAGRWLKISYTSLAAPGGAKGAPPFTVISEVNASDGQRVAYHYEFPDGADYPVLTRVDYPDGTQASYKYATPRPAGRLLLAQAIDPHGDRNLRGRMFHYRSEADAAHGQLLEIRAAEGGAIIQSLAADGRTLRGYAVGESNGATVYRTYHPGGNLVEEVDAIGFARMHEYDAEGRGFKTAVTDELGHVTRFENDVQGRRVKVTFPDGAVRSWQRDTNGRVIVETDELRHQRILTRDAKGRVVKVQHPDGAAEEMTYNEFGQIASRTDRVGAITTSTYDRRGLRTKITNALGTFISFAYDAQDRLIATTDPRSNTTAMSVIQPAG
ncbi:MAG: hypothetical protein ACREIA_13440 [Opitutaceae bacterium]